ncbi:MAG: hypothetical protein GY820_30355 [Gammaproteobacteria bacterium]|nr:hypothetical protein [Gammaproteobacteria bacterium]
MEEAPQEAGSQFENEIAGGEQSSTSSRGEQQLLRRMEELSMNCLSSIRLLLPHASSEESERITEMEKVERQLKSAALKLEQFKGAGVGLLPSGVKSSVMTKQRDQDPIELQRRKKRGDRRRADALVAAQYVDSLNEQLTCQSCLEQGAPPFSLIWNNEHHTEDEQQWRWIKCTQCPDDQNLFHTSCVDPSLYQNNSECFICEHCIGYSVQSKDGSSLFNCYRFCTPQVQLSSSKDPSKMAHSIGIVLCTLQLSINLARISRIGLWVHVD